MKMMRAIDRDNPQKLYVQMLSLLRERIESREWPAGSQIPTEDELCRIFLVSKATVRIAIAELVRSGHLRKQQGRGTFVTFAPQQRGGITMRTRLSEEMFGEGVNVRKELLVRGVQEPAQDVRDVLRTHSEVYYILCKRVADGEPAYLEESFIPLDQAPGIEDQDVCLLTIYEVVQQNGERRIHRVIQSIEIGEARGDAAAILRAGEGAPVLLFHRLLVGQDGRPLAYNRLTGSGRKYKLQAELVQMT